MHLRSLLALILAAALAACASTPPPPPPEPEPEPVVEEPPPPPEPEPPPPPPGEWSVSALSVRQLATAEAQAEVLRAQGYANVEIRDVHVENATWYRLVIPGFYTQDEARAVAERIGATPGWSGAWVLPPG